MILMMLTNREGQTRIGRQLVEKHHGNKYSSVFYGYHTKGECLSIVLKVRRKAHMHTNFST